jgi:hypothetical protein
MPRSRGFTAAFSVPAIHVYNPQSMAYASFLMQQIIIVKPVHLDRSIRLLSSTLDVLDAWSAVRPRASRLLRDRLRRNGGCSRVVALGWRGLKQEAMQNGNKLRS